MAKPRGESTDAEHWGGPTVGARRLVMRPEQRGRVKRLHSAFNWQQEERMSATKPYSIDKKLVYEAFKAVKANAGRRGGQAVDRGIRSGLEETTCTRSGTGCLGKLLPPAGQSGVHSEKEWRAKDPGSANRSGPLAQMVVKMTIEPDLDPDLPAEPLWLSSRKVGARTPSARRGSVAGDMTGYSSSTSRAYSTTSTTRSCYERFTKHHVQVAATVQ